MAFTMVKVMKLAMKANTDRFLDRNHEDLAVTDLAGLGSRLDGFDGLPDEVFGYGYVNHDLREEVDRVFTTAVDFRMPLLAAKSFDLGDCHSFDANLGKSFFHFLELERLYDSFN